MINMESRFSLAWIRQRRKSLGLTYKELAQQIGCAVVTLKKIEAGERKPSTLMAEKLAECLKVATEERPAFVARIRGFTADVNISHTEPVSFQVPLIGRESELKQLQKILTDPLTRLVTITGTGGVGKTRLAQAVLEAFIQDQQLFFYGGVFFIDLSSLISAEYLELTIAQALGLALDASGKDPRSSLQQLIDFMRGKKVLLILDNFEHILAGVEKMEVLLRSLPTLRVLVTSRERLGLWNEQLFPLKGLPYPVDSELSPQELEEYGAIALFLAHSRRILPSFQVTEQNRRVLVRIGTLMEGNSLAIELAAAWVDTLTLEDITAELEADLALLRQRGSESAGRHASMERVFESSLQRLGVEDTRIFCRLCLFQGGFSRPAAMVVAGAHLNTLSVFIQKSLVYLSHRDGKYHLHELLRQYGYEVLKATHEFEAASQAHFDYFLELAKSAESRLRGPEQITWLERLDAERDNLRFALQWGVKHPQNSEALVDLVGALTWYWRMRSYIAEACSWLEKIRTYAHPSPRSQAKLHWISGHHEWMRGAFQQARQHQQAGILLLESLGMEQTEDMGKLKVSLGMALAEEGNSPSALQAFTEALDIFQALQIDWWIAFTLGCLALPLYDLGNKSRARQTISDCINLFRSLGDGWALGLNLDHFASIEYTDRNLGRAEALAKEALVYEDIIGHKHSVGQILVLLGQIAKQRELYSQAQDYYRQSLEIFEQMGHPFFTQQVRQHLDDLAELIE